MVNSSQFQVERTTEGPIQVQIQLTILIAQGS
jgi:hypothetical protein